MADLKVTSSPGPVYSSSTSSLPNRFRAASSTRLRERLRKSMPVTDPKTYLGSSVGPAQADSRSLVWGHDVERAGVDGAVRKTVRRKKDSPRDLRDLIPIRREFSFAHPLSDYNDEFFIVQFTGLFSNINTFSRHTFGHVSSDFTGHPTWTWRELSPQLHTYAELVALGDRSVNSWTGLLEYGEDRCLLVQAVITKVLMLHIFSQLLFGAKVQQMNFLATQDAIFKGQNAYDHARLRSQTIQMILSASDGRPALFWPTVDMIATQISSLLIPLINMVGQLDPGVPPLSSIHQSVHEIVAFAGWLAVCVSWSPSIIRIDWYNPGEIQHAEEKSQSPYTYDLSQRVAAKWDDERSHRNNIMIQARIPRVKISIAPTIVRYARAYSPEGGFGTEQLYPLVGAQVALYSGLLNEDADRATRETLAYHIDASRPMRATIRFYFIKLFIPFLTAIMLIIILVSYIATRPTDSSSGNSGILQNFSLDRVRLSVASITHSVYRWVAAISQAIYHMWETDGRISRIAAVILRTKGGAGHYLEGNTS